MASINDNSTGRNIISVQEVQNYINNTDTSLTGFIQQCISNVSSNFENYCNRGFKFNTYVGIYDYNSNNFDNNKIYTNQFPIISLSSLQYRISPTSEWQDFYNMTDSASANILVYENFIELYDKEFPVGKQNIKINYVAGYTDCPGDLKQIAIENVVQILGESSAPQVGKGLLGIKSQNSGGSVGNENYTFGNLDERTKNVLDKYRSLKLY